MAEHRPTDTLLELMRQALARAPQGLAPRQLLAHLASLGEDISRPTLNRLLVQGLEQGLWATQGQGRSVVYLPIQPASSLIPSSDPTSMENTDRTSEPVATSSNKSAGKGKRARKAASSKAPAKPANIYDRVQSVIWGVADTLRDKTGLQVEAYQPVTLAIMILKRNMDIQSEQLAAGGRLAQILEDELPLLDIGVRSGEEVALRLNAVNRFWNPEKLRGNAFGLPLMSWADLSEFETQRNKAIQEAARRGEHIPNGAPVKLVLRANPEGRDSPETALFTYTTTATDLKSFIVEIIEALDINFYEAFAAIGIHGVMASHNEHSATLPNDVLLEICSRPGGFRDFVLDLKSVPNDVFSDAYMNLLERFAEASGKRGGEYFTPTKLVDAAIDFTDMDEILEELANDPSWIISVADPTSGSNTFLIRFYDKVRAAAQAKGMELPGPERFAFYAQELKNTQVGLGIFNMGYHGLADRLNLTEEEIRQGGRAPGQGGLVSRVLGNTITDYVPKLGKQAGKIDFAFGNPPYGLDDYGIAYATQAQGDGLDLRWINGGGVPTRSEGEWAFIHTFSHLLSENGKWGRATIILPMGVLFRDGGAEFRRVLIERDWLEGVIATPNNQFLTTSIPVCIMILNKNKKPESRGGVFFINATEDFTKVGKFNEWDHTKAVKAWRERSEIAGYCGFVSSDRLAKAPGYSLAVNRWFAPIREKKLLDPRQMATDVSKVRHSLDTRGRWLDGLLSQAAQLWTPPSEESVPQEDK